MTWTAPRTWVTSEVVTAALLNTHLRDNMLETAPAKVTTAGDIIYATGANAATRLGIGSAGAFLKGGASAPEWDDTLDGDLKLNTPNRHFKLLESDGADPADYWFIEHEGQNLKVGLYDDSLASTDILSNMERGDYLLHTGAKGQAVGSVVIKEDTSSTTTALTTAGIKYLDVLAVDTGGPAYVEGFWMVTIQRTSAASVSGLSIRARVDGVNLSTWFAFASDNTGIANDIIPSANDMHTFSGSFFNRVTANDTSDYELFLTSDDNSRFQAIRGFMYVRSIAYPT